MVFNDKSFILFYFKGDVLLHLAAIDPDDEELEFGLIGEFYNKLLEIKRIDGKNADIVLKQPFDREVNIKIDNYDFFNLPYEYFRFKRNMKI